MDQYSRTRQPGHNRTGHVTGQLRQDSGDRTTRRGELGQDSPDKTERTGQQGQEVGIGKPEWTYGTEKPKESQDSTAWTELLGHDSNDRTDGTEQLNLHN
jgi:hypothetical protein